MALLPMQLPVKAPGKTVKMGDPDGVLVSSILTGSQPSCYSHLESEPVGKKRFLSLTLSLSFSLSLSLCISNKIHLSKLIILDLFEGREGRERKIDSICWFPPQMPPQWGGESGQARAWRSMCSGAGLCLTHRQLPRWPGRTAAPVTGPV